MWFDPTALVMVSGSAEGGSQLNAFDNALRAAGISDFNLLRVTSILPPGLPVLHMKASVPPVSGNGLLVPTIFDSLASDSTGVVISSAIAIGIPSGGNSPGVAFYHSQIGDRDECEAVARSMVKEGMEARGCSAYRCELTSASDRVLNCWTAVVTAAIFCDTETSSILLPHSLEPY